MKISIISVKLKHLNSSFKVLCVIQLDMRITDYELALKKRLTAYFKYLGIEPSEELLKRVVMELIFNNYSETEDVIFKNEDTELVTVKNMNN